MHPEQVFANGFKAVDYQNIFYFAHPEWIKTFKKNKIYLNAWTINKDEDMDWFIKNKFDAISSNSLDSLIRNRLITDAMATSIMNDNALSRSIAKNLRHAAEIINKSQEIDA